MAFAYKLRAFYREEEVITCDVANNVPYANTYPRPGQIIGKWKITEIIKNSEQEFHVRVEPLKVEERE